MRRIPIAVAALLAVAACGSAPPPEVTRMPPPITYDPELVSMYGPLPDGERIIPAVAPHHLSHRNKRQEVDFWTDEAPGTIIVDPYERFLYFVLEGDRAIRYGVAVGEAGRSFSGVANMPYTRDWPSWTPTQNMIEREPDIYGPWAGGQPGGLDNPLGARALYLFQDGRDTLYRIHGTAQPWTIGQAASSGCIRLYNQDIVDLESRVDSGAKVIVLSEEDSGMGTRPPGSLRPAEFDIY